MASSLPRRNIPCILRKLPLEPMPPMPPMLRSLGGPKPPLENDAAAESRRRRNELGLNEPSPRISSSPSAEMCRKLPGSDDVCRSAASRVELPGVQQAADESASYSAMASATARSPPTPKRPRRMLMGEDTSEAATAAASNIASISRSCSACSSDAAAATAAAASLAILKSAMAKPTRVAKPTRLPGGERGSGDDSARLRGSKSSAPPSVCDIARFATFQSEAVRTGGGGRALDGLCCCCERLPSGELLVKLAERLPPGELLVTPGELPRLFAKGAIAACMLEEGAVAERSIAAVAPSCPWQGFGPSGDPGTTQEGRPGRRNSLPMQSREEIAPT